MLKKMKIEKILNQIEKITPPSYWKIERFTKSLDLTKEQFEILANHENDNVKYAIAEHPNLPEDLIYKLYVEEGDFIKSGLGHNCNLPKDLLYELADYKDDFIRYIIAYRSDLPKDLIIKLNCDVDTQIYIETFTELGSLSSEDLESAYDLIRKSKNVSGRRIEETFDFIIDKFSGLSELAKMFKRIILKGKKDLK